MANLRITSHDGRIQDLPVEKNEIWIGRGKENDIVLQDHTVSRSHAKILRSSKGFFIIDLGSFNGTKVNGKSVQKAALQDNDRIRIGNTSLTLFTGQTARPSPSDSLVLNRETEFENGEQQIVASSLKDSGHQGSQELLISLESQKMKVEQGPSKSTKMTSSRFNEELTSLERANKVLFVLYEISRQLNTIHDFHELLDKIMDLILMVIDADYGFLILMGEEENDLTPVVVKSKDGDPGDRRDLKASRTIINRVIRDKVALLTSNAMADSRLDHAKSLFIKQIRSAMCVPLWKKDHIIGVCLLYTSPSPRD